MKLIWYKRQDGLWNAACACNATLCGTAFEQRAAAETAHFNNAHAERWQRGAHKIPACGPKLPEHNPNLPDPWIFP